MATVQTIGTEYHQLRSRRWVRLDPDSMYGVMPTHCTGPQDTSPGYCQERKAGDREGCGYCSLGASHTEDVHRVRMAAFAAKYPPMEPAGRFQQVCQCQNPYCGGLTDAAWRDPSRKGCLWQACNATCAHNARKEGARPSLDPGD
jgi:hypothetical protein